MILKDGDAIAVRISFQLKYRNNAWKPGVKKQIIELTINSSGVRDFSRTLHINKNTVISELKKRHSQTYTFST